MKSSMENVSKNSNNVDELESAQQINEKRDSEIIVEMETGSSYDDDPEDYGEKLSVVKDIMPDSKLAAMQRRENVSISTSDKEKSVPLLRMRSLIYNRSDDDESEREYRNKIKQWISYKEFGHKLLDAEAQCDNLKIIFDFECNSVSNVDLPPISGVLESTNPTSKFIQQQVLAHVICHYVMRLVYQNDESPYYQSDEQAVEEFNGVTDAIKNMLFVPLPEQEESTEDSDAEPQPEEPNNNDGYEDFTNAIHNEDECDGIISTVYTLYPIKDWHQELIVRPAHIQAQFDDDEKYKILIEFCRVRVIPEMEKFNLTQREKVQEFNNFAGLLSEIVDFKVKLSKLHYVSDLIKNQLLIVTTNVPKLLLLNIYEHLNQKCQFPLLSAQNIFMNARILENSHMFTKFKEVLLQEANVKIFVDCSKGLGKITEVINSVRESSSIFLIVSNEKQCGELRKKLEENDLKPAKVTEYYYWMDLAEESQNLMLQSRVNFQNSPNFSLTELIELEMDPQHQGSSISEDLNVVDERLLNLLLEREEIQINPRAAEEINDKHFRIIFQTRNLKRKKLIIKKVEESADAIVPEEPDGAVREIQLKTFFGKISNLPRFISKKITKPFRASTEEDKVEPGVNRFKKYVEILKSEQISQKQMLEDVKAQKFVLIPDIAGSGKSWMMKNFTNKLRELHLMKWTTYVDLKQFIDEFKSRDTQHEFSIFMAEKILKLKTKFDADFFKNLYEMNDLVFDYLGTENLRKIISESKILIFGLSLKAEDIKRFIDKIESKTGFQFISEELQGRDENMKNVLFHSIESDNCNLEEKFEVINKYLSPKEFVKLAKQCNDDGEGIFQVCAEAENESKFKELPISKERLDGENALHYAAKCDNIEFHGALWELLLKHFENQEVLMDMLLQKDVSGLNFVHLLISSNKPDVIEFTFQNLKANFSDAQYKQILRSKDFCGRNLLQITACTSKDIKTHQILWRTFQDSCKSNEEFLEVLKEVDRNSDNIFHLAASFSTSEIFEFMVHELETVASSNEIREIISNLGSANQNLLQLAAKHNSSFGVHEILWKIFRNYFNSSEIFKIIQHVNEFGENLLLTAVRWNTKEIVEQTWNQIKNFLTQNEKIEYFKVMGIYGDNFMSAALENKENPGVYEWVRGQLHEIEEIIEFEEYEEFEEIYDEKGLIKAVINNNLKEVERLLKSGIDVNKEDINQLSAVDYAWLNYKSAENYSEKINKIILLLLNANSKFPSWRVGFKYEEASKEVRDCLDMCESLHRDVENGRINNFLELIKQHPHLRYFHDRTNESVLLFALKRQRFNILNKLNGELSVREDESLREIYYEIFMDIDEDTTENNENKLPPPHILTLMAKSRIKNTSRHHKHWRHIENAYKLINETKSCSTILKLAAAWKDLKIVFDFNKNFTQMFLNEHPKLDGVIRFRAKELLDENEKWKVIGVMIHELCHVAVHLAYMNDFNPYPAGDSAEKRKYETVFNNIKEKYDENRKIEGIVKDTFGHPEKEQHSELIVRPMQMVMHYYKNSTKINELQRIFKDLFDYVREVVEPEMKRAISVVRKLQNEEEFVAFRYLTEPMKAKILQTPLIFQGTDTTFFDIIGNDTEILNVLSAEDIRRMLLKNKGLKIGSAFEDEPDRFTVQRKFIKKGINVDDSENEVKSIEEIADGVHNSKVLILSENAGAGKTTTFEDLTMKLKKHNKSFWVSFIKLRKYREIFNKFKVNVNAVNMQKLLLQIFNIQSELDTKFFEYMFQNGKLIILFDGFDEIAPELSELMFAVVKELKENTTNQIWISTRPHFAEALEEKLNSDSYKFVRLTNEERMEFVKEVFKESTKADILANIERFFDTIDEELSSTIDNPLMIKIIAQIFESNEINSNIHLTNSFDMVEKFIGKHKENLYNKIFFGDNLIETEMTFANLHQVFALKTVFGRKYKKYLGTVLNGTAIMKKWEKDESNWTVEKIQSFGFLTVKPGESSLNFIHKIYADFFVAQFIASFMFERAKAWKDEEYEKTFKILRLVSKPFQDFKAIRKFLEDYVKFNIKNLDDELDETFKRTIENGMSKMREDISNMKQKDEILRFWSAILTDGLIQQLTKNVIYGFDKE